MLSAEIANAYGEAYIEFRRDGRPRPGPGRDRPRRSEPRNADARSRRPGPKAKALNNQLDQLQLSQALQTGGAELVQPAGAALRALLAAHRPET